MEPAQLSLLDSLQLPFVKGGSFFALLPTFLSVGNPRPLLRPVDFCQYKEASSFAPFLLHLFGLALETHLFQSLKELLALGHLDDSFG